MNESLIDDPTPSENSSLQGRGAGDARFLCPDPIIFASTH